MIVSLGGYYPTEKAKEKFQDKKSGRLEEGWVWSVRRFDPENLDFTKTSRIAGQFLEYVEVVGVIASNCDLPFYIPKTKERRLKRLIKRNLNGRLIIL